MKKKKYYVRTLTAKREGRMFPDTDNARPFRERGAEAAWAQENPNDA